MAIGNVFKKKLTPEELKTKLLLSSKKLEKREAQLKDKAETTRRDAKGALKRGDDRAFRLSSKRYGMVQGQINTISGMVEMTMSMADIVEMQEGLKEVVDIGNELKTYQERLGLDTKALEQAVTNIRLATEKVNTASEMITQTMDAISSGDIEVNTSQESLKKELLAELKSEGEEGAALEEKIKSATKTT